MVPATVTSLSTNANRPTRVIGMTLAVVVMLVGLPFGLMVSTMLPTGQPTQQPAQMSNVSVTQMRVVTKAHTVPMVLTSGSYTVKAGDTLGKIAAKHGTSVAALASANGIQNVNVIGVGDVLKIGNAPSAPPAPQAQSASSHTSSVGERALAAANRIDGMNVPYVWGGKSMSGFDCSGFVGYVFGKAGYDISGSSSSMSGLANGDSVISVPRDEIRAGDIVFFYSPVSHVGIAKNSSEVVHASTDGNALPDQIKTSDISAMPFHNAIRVVG